MEFQVSDMVKVSHLTKNQINFAKTKSHKNKEEQVLSKLPGIF